jgi:hypothetical protein
MGSEIISDALMVLLDDEAQVEARFCLFGDSANLDTTCVHYGAERSIGLEIILGAPDQTSM